MLCCQVLPGRLQRRFIWRRLGTTVVSEGSDRVDSLTLTGWQRELEFSVFFAQCVWWDREMQARRARDSVEPSVRQADLMVVDVRRIRVSSPLARQTAHFKDVGVVGAEVLAQCDGLWNVSVVRDDDAL